MTARSSTAYYLDHDGADRLTAVLMKAFEQGQGVDPLNSKRVQLQNLGPSLEHLFQDLRREMSVLSARADAPRPWQSLPCQTLERLSAQVAELIKAGRADVS